MTGDLRRNVRGKWQQHLYWNANNANVVIVALEGDARDYAAYIGAGQGLSHEHASVEHVILHGDKIDRKLAEHLFPDFNALGLEYRR